MAQILHTHARERYRAGAVVTPRDKGGVTAAVCAVARRVRAAVIGGLLFAVSPVHAEVVAAINYREDLEAAVAVFGLVAWLFLPGCRRNSNHRVLAAALLTVGLFGKESTVIVFPLAAAIAVTRFRLVDWARSRRESLAVLAVVAALWSAWRAWLKWSGRD